MTNEQIVFLQGIKDYIGGEKTEIIENVDWQTVYDYACSHQMTAIFYAQYKDGMPSNCLPLFQASFYATVSHNVRRKKNLDDVFSSFIDAGINYFILKGDEIAKYYPNWQYRTMGDVDIVVEDRNAVREIMNNKGFVLLSSPEEGDWKYNKQDCEVELHNKLIYDSDEVAYAKVKSFFESYRSYVQNNCLDLNFHFTYLILHLRKHFMKYGVGFRQFLDIAMMIKNCSELDWNIISSMLHESGLYDFATIVCGFIERWFGVRSPLGQVEIEDDVFEESTEYIFRNGVFGFDNNDNRKQLQMIRSMNDRFPFLYMCRDGLSKVFLPYSAMVKFDYCSFLEGNPFLLPIAWLKRILYTISNKGMKAGTDQISMSFVSKEYSIQREEMFRNWGLQ